jgi:hypothetical protein
MSHAKQVLKRKRKGKAMPVLGAAGLLAVVTGASAEAPVDAPTPNSGMSHQVLLGEEEISDVSLATFYVFDKETAASSKPGVQLARGDGRGCGYGCGGGCRGCGRGCGGGCRATSASCRAEHRIADLKAGAQFYREKAERAGLCALSPFIRQLARPLPER